jgi:hypothetical protein
VIGVHYPPAVSLVEGEINLKPDFATIQHLLMEEKIALDQILLPFLAIIRTAQLVSNS